MFGGKGFVTKLLISLFFLNKSTAYKRIGDKKYNWAPRG